MVFPLDFCKALKVQSFGRVRWSLLPIVRNFGLGAPQKTHDYPSINGLFMFEKFSVRRVGLLLFRKFSPQVAVVSATTTFSCLFDTFPTLVDLSIPKKKMLYVMTEFMTGFRCT